MHLKRISYLAGLVLFLLLTHITVNGQLQAPVIYRVTINPETGFDEITWGKIPLTPFTDYYIVAVRVNHELGQPETYVPISGGVPDTFYVNTNTESSIHPVGYTVWGVHVNSPNIELGFFNKPDSTIFLTSVMDSYNFTITLKWNNYNAWQGYIAGYNIYRRLGVDNYQLINSVREGTNMYVVTNLQVDNQYELFVEAVHDDGIRKSASNMVSVSTDVTQLPGDIVERKSLIYPIPAEKILHVDPNQSRGKIVRLDILNANGEVIISYVPVNYNNDYPISLDVSILPVGFYLCNLIYQSGISESLRFIK